jgi:hypothetical protein
MKICICVPGGFPLRSIAFATCYMLKTCDSLCIVYDPRESVLI